MSIPDLHMETHWRSLRSQSLPSSSFARNAVADPLVPSTWEFIGLAGLLVFLGLGDAFLGVGEAEYVILNSIASAGLTIILAVGAFQLGRRNSDAVWSSLFWFRVATAVYFGLGTLLPNYLNFTTRSYLDEFFQADSLHVFRLNLLVILSVFAVLAATAVTLQLAAPKAVPTTTRDSKSGLLPAGVIFAAIGFPIQFLLILPVSLGEYGDIAIPGTILSLSLLAPSSIYLLTREAILNRPRLMPIMVAVLAVDMGSGVLEYNKSDVIMPLIMFLLAYLSRGFSFRRSAVTAVAVFVTFSIVVPMTDFGRTETVRHYGSVTGGGLSDRWNVISTYLTGAAEAPAGEQIQGNFVRISYAAPAAFAMDLYDRGLPGPSLEYLWTVFIPRAIWPDKPILTDIGVAFNYLALGSTTSSSAPGLFADAYWSMGWLGIPVLMLPMGVILALLSRYSLWVIGNGKWLYFPLVLLAMRIGLRVDGFLVVDLFGPVVILLAMHFGIAVVDPSMSRRSAH
jgi:hypothetical protein